MTVKPTGKAKRTCISLIIAVLLALAALIYIDVRRGSVKWEYAIPLLSVLFVFSVLTAIITLRTFVFGKEGVEVRFLFYRKVYRWQDTDVRRELDVIAAPSRRGKGYLYGSTAAATSGMEAGKTGGTPSNYLSPHINVDTGNDRYVTKVSFYKKTGGAMKTSDTFQYVHPLSFIRVYLLPDESYKNSTVYHYAVKGEFIDTLSGYGVTLPEK